jgi:hypothetical protein
LRDLLPTSLLPYLTACVGLVGFSAKAHAQLQWSAVREVVAVSESEQQHTVRFPWTLPGPSGGGDTAGGGGSVTVTSITTGCGCTTARFVPPRKAPGSPTPGSSAPGSSGASDDADRAAGATSGSGGGASGGLVVLEPGEGALEAVFTFGDRVGRHVKKIVIRSRSTDPRKAGSATGHVTTLTLDLTIQPTVPSVWRRGAGLVFHARGVVGGGSR